MSFTNKPFFLSGEQIKTPSPKKNNYRVKSYSSEVDETLFGTPTRYVQQKETKRMSDEKEWDPPWATGPSKKGAPLLWTPFTSHDLQGRKLNIVIVLSFILLFFCYHIKIYLFCMKMNILSICLK